MSSVKEEALLSVSYLKYEQAKIQEEITEHEEYMKYINMLSYDKRQKQALKIAEIQKKLNAWRRELALINMQINNVKNYYELSKAEVQAVEIPTDEQLSKQWRAIERESKQGFTKDYTEQDQQRIFDTVKLHNHLQDMENYTDI